MTAMWQALQAQLSIATVGCRCQADPEIRKGGSRLVSVVRLQYAQYAADRFRPVSAVGVGDADPWKAALERGRSPTGRGVALTGTHLSAHLCQGCNAQSRLTCSRIQALWSNWSAVNWSARSASPGSSLYWACTMAPSTAMPKASAICLR